MVCLLSPTLLYRANAQSTVDHWSLNYLSLNSIPLGSPIAVASHTRFSDSQQPWIEVLSLSTNGIEVHTWLLTHEWSSGRHPSAMANSTNMKSYESVAVTATGKAFAVVKQDGQADSIESWRVEDDLINWRSTENVDLHGTWG